VELRSAVPERSSILVSPASTFAIYPLRIKSQTDTHSDLALIEKLSTNWICRKRQQASRFVLGASRPLRLISRSSLVASPTPRALIQY
jgi:hypothetical protein